MVLKSKSSSLFSHLFLICCSHLIEASVIRVLLLTKNILIGRLPALGAEGAGSNLASLNYSK